MAIETKKEIQLEIAHVLFIDIVGYSKLSISDQHAAIEELNQVVRASEQFRRAEAAGRLNQNSNRRRHRVGFLHKSGGTRALCSRNQPCCSRNVRACSCGWESTADQLAVLWI